MKAKVTTQHNRGAATIFKNPFLESLTKTSLKQNIIVYGLVVLLLIYNAIYLKEISVFTFIGLFIFTSFFWTYAEYILDRFVFHWMNENSNAQRFKYLWRHRSLHHYKHPDKAFGVSNTFWDSVFGTMPPKKS